ncbi:hypothetical protein LAZ67_15002762, partial [Cordylochernes scorpioides]
MKPDGRTVVQISSIYKKPDLPLQEEDLNLLLENNQSVIAAGDWNSKHPLWGSRTSNNSGTVLHNFSEKENLDIVAPSSPTHYSPLGNPDFLDIAILRNIPWTSRIKTLDALSSDHLPVILELTCPKDEFTTRACRLTNWVHFQQDLISSTPPRIPLKTEANIDSAVTLLNDKIYNSYSKNTVISSSSSKQNPSTKALIKEKNKARKRWQATWDPAHRAIYLNLQGKVNKALKSDSTENWNQFIHKIESSPKDFWRKTKPIRKKTERISSLVTNGKTLLTDKEIGNELAEHFSNQFSKEKEEDQPNITYNHQQEKMLTMTTPNEVKEVIKYLANHKAPGHDNITPQMAKNLPIKWIVFLAGVFNAALHLCYYPKVWKHAIIIPIPKKSAKSPEDLRPISLLPTIGKIYERIILRRLQMYLDNSNFIIPQQFGFRRGHSTTHQLIAVLDYIQIRRSHKEVNPSTKALIKEKNKARKRWQATWDPAHRAIYLNLQGKVNKALKSDSTENWNQFIHKIESSPKDFWRKTKPIRKKTERISSLVTNGKTLLTDKEIGNELAEHFSNQFSKEKEEDQPNITYNHQQEKMLTMTTPNEVKEVIKYLANHKAPGHDNITPQMAKNLPIKWIVFLAGVFNAALHLCYYPKVWKHAIIIPIPKKSAKSPEDLRPISLLPTIGKIYERIILRRLQMYLDNSNFIIPQQFGFRRGHSTTHQLISVLDYIQIRRSHKKAVGAVFLDFAKAFDKVWHNGLIKKLTKHQFSSDIINFMQNYLQGRTFSVKQGNFITEPKPIQTGVPQGSILGPYLFNIYINDIPLHSKCKLKLFADDTAILFNSKSVNLLVTQLQNYLNDIIKWCDEWKLDINPTKTQAIVFPPRDNKKFKPQTNLTVNSSTISWADHAKYLGVTLDSKLKFNLHVQNTIRKAKIAKISLSSLLNFKSNLTTKHKFTLYKTCILPIITYALPVWGKYITPTDKKRIDAFMRICLRTTIGAPFNLSNKILKEDLNQPNIEEIYQDSATRLFSQFQKSSNPTIQEIVQNQGAHIPSGIVARSNLHPIPLTSPDTAITSIAICLEQSIIVVHSAYWHGLRAADDFIPLLEDTIRRTSLPVILGMDTNAHSPTWGIGARLDFRGANLEEFASFNDFHFLGPPVDSTWSNGPLSSSIDVTLASSSLAIHVTRGLLDEMAFTDHIPIWTTFLDMVNNETKSSLVESSCKEQTFKSFLNSSLHQLDIYLGFTTEDYIIREQEQVYSSMARQYRPITLLNTMAKVFERCILARLQRLADRHGWFFEDQYKTVLGTVNGRSAEDALASITQLIEERQAHWRKTLVISSDISKAFDTVWRPAIIQNLERLNCSESITCLVKSFLEDRTVSYSAWTATECTSSQLGTPQGSALSPFLWNIVARTIFTLPSIIDSRLIAYADDFTLMTQLDGASAWGGRALSSEGIRQLRSLHCNFAKRVLRGGPYTLTVSAISITGSPPFDIIVRSRTAFLKEINEGNFESRPGPASLPYPPDRRQLSFSLNIEEITTPIIFTDGSKNEAGVGAAIVPSSEDQQPVLLRLHPDCTAFQAELLAIRWAVRLVKEGYSRNAITIASDCRSALSAICTSGPVRSTLVAKIILALNTNQNVNLCWVPGHCGIDGKERADRAAKNAAVLILEPSFSILPRSLARNHSRVAALDAWTEVYCQDHYNRHLRRIAHTPDRLLQFLPKVCPGEVTTTLLTGHGHVRADLVLWRLGQDPSCPHCMEEQQTVDHLLFRCPAFKQHRMKTALL